MKMQTDTTVTKKDLDKIEESLKRVIEVAKTQKSTAEVDDMLKAISHTVNDLKMTIEFDHEKRLSAVEDYLQNM